MVKKWVALDKDGWLTEIDEKALLKEALALRNYILKASAQDEAVYSFKTRLLPLVEAVLNSSLVVPFKGEIYSTRLMMQGLEPELPLSIDDYYFPFIVRIKGTPSVSSPSFKATGKYVPELQEKDGIRYSLVDFED